MNTAKTVHTCREECAHVCIDDCAECANCKACKEFWHEQWLMEVDWEGLGEFTR